MYGDGFTSRSTRYTSSGSTGSTRSKRCASTTWKMSPSRMCSFAASTAAAHCAPLEVAAHLGQLGRARRRAAAPARTAAGGRGRRPRRRAARPRRRSIASSVASSAPGGGYTFSMRKQRWRKWSNAATLPASEHTASGKPEVVGRRRRAGARSRARCRSPSSRRCRRGTAAARAASARGTASSSASSAASVPWSVGTPSGGGAADPLDVAARARRTCAPGSRPRNEKRPQRSACSTDSSRKPSRSPTSFTNADSGVSRSASTSRHTGTTV